MSLIILHKIEIKMSQVPGGLLTKFRGIHVDFGGLGEFWVK